MDQCWLSVRLSCGGQHSRRDVGLLPRLHGTAALSMVMVSAGFLWAVVSQLQRPPEHGGARLASGDSWFGRVVALLALWETVLWRSAFETRVGLLPRLHGTATLPMVMVSAGFL